MSGLDFSRTQTNSHTTGDEKGAVFGFFIENVVEAKTIGGKKKWQ